MFDPQLQSKRRNKSMGDARPEANASTLGEKQEKLVAMRQRDQG